MSARLTVGGQAQPEQIGQPRLFGPRHHRLDAPGDIAAQQRRPMTAPQAIEQRPQPGLAVLRRVCVARLHIDPQHQAQIRH